MLLAGADDVVAHGSFGAVRVGCGEGLHDAAVFLEGAAALGIVAEEGDAGGVVIHALSIEEALEVLAAGDVVDGAVEAFVQFDEVVDLAICGCLGHRGDGGSQAVTLLFRGPAGGEAGDHAFECGAGEGHFLGLVGREGDVDAAPGFDTNQSFGFEAAKGLLQRCCADAEFGGELSFVEALLRAEPAGDDGFAQGVMDVFPQAFEI